MFDNTYIIRTKFHIQKSKLFSIYLMSSDGTYDPVKDFREQALVRHNILRSKHIKTGPLILDEDLCQVSHITGICRN